MIQTFKSYMLNELEHAVELLELLYILLTNSYILKHWNAAEFSFFYCFIYQKQDKLTTFNIFTYYYTFWEHPAPLLL